MSPQRWQVLASRAEEFDREWEVTLQLEAATGTTLDRIFGPHSHAERKVHARGFPESFHVRSSSVDMAEGMGHARSSSFTAAAGHGALRRRNSFSGNEGGATATTPSPVRVLDLLDC